MTDIIIDLETLGTRPGCPIIEIGACAMDPDTGRIVGCFGRRTVCALSWTTVTQIAAADYCSLQRDRKDTINWWFADNDRKATLKKILSGGIPLRSALFQFGEWLGRTGGGNYRIWANGPSFDISILERAYWDEDIPRPWDCRQERCVRTALEQAAYERGSVSWMERGPRHRALNDARHEARKLFYSGALGVTSAVIRRLRQRGVVKVGEAL